MTEDWPHKHKVRVRTVASFITTALIWAAYNSSEAPVLMLVWQIFHSLDTGRVWFREDRAGMRGGCCLTQGHFSNQANHGSQVRVYWLRAPNHTEPGLHTPSRSLLLHCTHQGSQALGYKLAITLVWVPLFSLLFIDNCSSSISQLAPKVSQKTKSLSIQSLKRITY